MFEGQPKGLWALALANTGERFGYYTMLAVFLLYLQAYEVCSLLAQIDPDAACYADAAKLMTEVKRQVRSDIDFEMRQKYNDQVKIERERIAAIRAIGVAYGKGQQPTTTNLMFLR